MSVISISRNTQNNVCIVSMIVTDTLATVLTTNYIKNQMPTIQLLNQGSWQWFASDMLLVAASNGNAFFTFTDSTFSSLNEYSGGSSGVVNPGTANQLAYYATSGTTLSGLTSGNNGVLITSNTGVPSISSTLPSGIHATNMVLTTPNLGTPSAGVLTNCTGLPIAGISGLGTGVATALAAAVTGSGGIVLATSPTLVTPALGTPASGVLTNCTGLPIIAGTTGTLTIARGGTSVTSVTIAPTASAWAGWDANSNMSANSFLSGYTTTATAAGTTTLTVGSTYLQFFTGTTTQTVALPVTSTLVTGQSFFIVNNSTGVITVQSSGGNTIQAMAASTSMLVTCILTSGTTAASWSAAYAAGGGGGPFTQSGSFSAYGPGANSTMGTSSFAVGNNAEANGNDSIAIGDSSHAGSGSTVALGNSSSATGAQSIAIGFSASTSTFQNCIAIGASSSCAHNQAIAIGNGATATGIGSIALGEGVTANNLLSCVIGGGGGGGTYADSASNQLTASFSGGFFFAKNSTTLWVNIDSSGNLINLLGTADQSYSLQAPSTGFSITIGAGVKSLVLNPAATLATGTIVMPAAPIDGQEIRVSTNNTITSLTVSANSGQTISNAPSTLVAGSGFAYIYNLSGTNWYRLY